MADGPTAASADPRARVGSADRADDIVTAQDVTGSRRRASGGEGGNGKTGPDGNDGADGNGLLNTFDGVAGTDTVGTFKGVAGSLDGAQAL